MNTTKPTLISPVLIVEDDGNMHQRLQGILYALGYQQGDLVFADTLATARQLINQQTFALALVDLGLPDGNGIELIAEIFQQDNECIILVISAWSTAEAILQALQAGATGYVLKERDNFEVSLSIQNVLRGGAPIDPFVAQHILATINPPSQALASEQNAESDSLQFRLEDTEQLTCRELEILTLVAQGLSNREIANLKSLSRYTVDSHIKHIYKKLAVNNRTKAILTARSLGILR